MNSNDVVRNSSLSANEKLALAVHCDSPARVKAALVSGADPDYCEKGTPMIIFACNSRGLMVLRTLLAYGGNPHQGDNRGFSAMHMVSQCGHWRAIQLLLQQGVSARVQDKNSWTPLHYATFMGHRRAAHQLLLAGADPNSADLNGRTPMYWGPIIHDDVKMARMLVRYGATVRTTDRLGKTPLHYAAQQAQTSIVERFISYGANLHARDQDGYTALHYAAQLYAPNTVILLLQNGADFRAPDRHGNTPLHLAARPYVVEALLQAGADPLAQNKCGQSPLDLAIGPRRGVAGWAAVAMLRHSPKVSPMTLCRLLRNTVRRAIWIRASNELVSELLHRGVSPASLGAQDFQLMLAHVARYNQANQTTGIPPRILQMVRILANQGLLIPSDLTSELL